MGFEELDIAFRWLALLFYHNNSQKNQKKPIECTSLTKKLIFKQGLGSDDDEWSNSMKVNVASFAFMGQACYEHMKVSERAGIQYG